MVNVTYEDYTAKVAAELNEVTFAWLDEVGHEIASRAKRNVKLDGEAGQRLRESYKHEVDKASGEVKIGSPEESVYWEEFGTGEYADTSKNGGKKGRQGWWVYIEGGSGYQGPTEHYRTQKEAEEAAAYIRKEYRLNAVATKGRKPAYTLLSAFSSSIEKAKKGLEDKLRRLGGQK